MKCKSVSDLKDDSPFAINDTKEITAKRLLMYFVETFDPLAELLTDSDTLKALHKLLEIGKGKGLNFDEHTIIENLPWLVCECFSQFLLECPHIHVTID
ncbi:MAG: hypothetical protein K2L51_00965 [Clostridiales bacterium]|nr:hypothetical protein [Clostridiales bacterium]